MPLHKWFEVHLYPAGPLNTPGQTLDRGRHYLCERGSRINKDASARTCDVDPFMGSAGNAKVICGIHANRIVKDRPELLVVVVQVFLADKLICETFKSKDDLEASKCDFFTSELEVPADKVGGTIRVHATAGCSRLPTVPEVFEFRLRPKRAGDEWNPTVDRFRQEARSPKPFTVHVGMKRGQTTTAQRAAPQGLVPSGNQLTFAPAGSSDNHATLHRGVKPFTTQPRRYETLPSSITPVTASHAALPPWPLPLSIQASPVAQQAHENTPLSSLVATDNPSSSRFKNSAAAESSLATLRPLKSLLKQPSIPLGMSAPPTSPTVKLEENEMQKYGPDLAAPCNDLLTAQIAASWAKIHSDYE